MRIPLIAILFVALGIGGRAAVWQPPTTPAQSNIQASLIELPAVSRMTRHGSPCS